MSRYWRVYRSFVKSSLQRDLEFRANFIAKIFQNMIWVVFFIVMLQVIYSHTNSIAGWSKANSLILAATCFIIDATLQTLTMSLMELPQQVRQGTLDFVVTKPIDSQFWVSTRKFSFDHIGRIVVGFGLLIYAVSQSGLTPSLLEWGAYFLLCFVGLAIFYAIMMFFMTLGIWFVRVENLWVLGDTAFQVARYPIDIFPASVRGVLTYWIPIAFLSTVPSRALISGVDWVSLGAGLAYAAVAFFAGRWFWRYSLAHYSSASS